MIQVPQKENTKLHTLANLRPTTDIIDFENSYVVHLFSSTIDGVNLGNLSCDLCNKFVDYLKNVILPEDKNASL